MNKIPPPTSKSSRSRLHRLLAPRSIVFIGGKIAEMALTRCREAGFEGKLYVVHPSKKTVGGVPCYPSIEALPTVPDAAYVGVNRSATIDVVRSLAALGAGGCVCYAAGFAEVGGEGIELQQQLIEAAGAMPLVGPNCFGFINYVDQLALWPYVFGGHPVDRGVALISQSGNVAMNLTMNERSVQFTHVICAGNQAVLGPADYLEALLEDTRVRAIGMLLEGLDDLAAFARMAQRALERGIPIIVMKIGRTLAGAERASSHTSSLVGSDTLYDALFKRLGIIRVDSLNCLLETLKLFDVAPLIKGTDIVTLSCSGGEAGILADLCDTYGLTTPPFSATQTQALVAMFPGYVTVSNPFDYNTSIWGDKAAMTRCFTTSLSGAHHAALLVYDHPTIDAPEVAEWIDCLEAFIAAHAATGMPSFLACTVSELIPEALRTRLIEAGVVPLQGLDDALFAIAAAGRYYTHRQAQMATPLPRFAGHAPAGRAGSFLDEWDSKQRLSAAGLTIPTGQLVTRAGVGTAAREIGFPVALKACGSAFIHKSELAAVHIGLKNAADAEAAADAIIKAATTRGLQATQFIVESMASPTVAELIVGIHRDPQFGPTLVIGSGGILVELVGDSVSLLLPTDRAAIDQAVGQLKVATLIKGFRGRPEGDRAAAVDAILAIAAFACAHWDTIQELDVNPLIVLPKGCGIIAVDALLRFSEPQ
jgi:succinyl-CoA synthetase alpha subunit